MRTRRTRVKPSPLAVVALVVALATILGGCGGGSHSIIVGPLSSGNGIHDLIPNGSICAPGGRPWAFGEQQFTNYGHTTVVLDRVVLLHPRNQRLIGAYAMPGNQVIGTTYWPPNYRGLPPAWKDHRPVHSFRVAPGKSFNMVLDLAAIMPGRATSKGMMVYYHDSVGSYVAPNYFANIISANTRTC